MEFWTIMIITILSGPLEETQMGLIYPSEQACCEAVNQVTDTLSYDYKVECEVTDSLSTSIRPKSRPQTNRQEN